MNICKQCKKEYSEDNKIILLCPRCRHIRNIHLRLSRFKRFEREPLGTTDLSPHFCGDFKKERDIIDKEFKFLRLKKQNSNTKT